MLHYLYFVLTGCFCYGSTDVPNKTVLQNTMAVLPCAHKTGNVTWSRLINGAKVTLVTIENGVEKIHDKHYGSQADNSLVITKAISNDSMMYFCNNTKIYLTVTTDPNMVPVTPRNEGKSQKGIAPDAENHRPSDFWKVPVGVVMGAALVLLLILTLKFCSKNRPERNTNSEKTETEVIYEEIETGGEQPGMESYFTSTPPSDNLYSTVDKLTAKGHSREECVYYLAQNPLQTGNGSE